jgi:ATP-dependent DNA helicase RecG
VIESSEQRKIAIPLLKLLASVPNGYKNSRLFYRPEDGRVNTLHCRIVNSYISGKVLILKFYVLTSKEYISGTYFNYKPRHTKIFATGKDIYIRGKVSFNENYGFQIINPISINKPTGEIVPIYKNRAVEESLQNLFFPVRKFIDFTDVPRWVKDAIWELHLKPTDDIVRYYELYSTFPDHIVKALKFLEALHYIKGVKNSVVEAPALKKMRGDVDSWIKTLPFKLTNDQLKAIREIQSDFRGESSVRRVVVGDVGSGKTMVILASMVLAYPERSILMAPTSILANQLFEEAKKFLPENYRIELITSKTSKKVKNLDEVDILIGTNAIVHRDLSETPLIIVDEQHRFGTRIRNKLESLVKSENARPHFIQLSATPIPRTQAMINGTFIKTSLIEEIPFKKVIDTEVMFSKHFPTLLEKIKDEISKNHQILIIYPLVEVSEKIDYQSLEESEEYWKSNFEDVYVTHGRDKEKESVLMKFRENGKILLSTTVVEVGISLPRLTLIVIVGAERLGLATLHQLRGRVSRTGLQGYCYLYTKSRDKSVIGRLSKFAKTMNGFDIASMDLENRKGGDIISGEKQSGATFKWFNISTDKEIVKLVLEWIEFKDALIDL